MQVGRPKVQSTFFEEIGNFDLDAIGLKKAQVRVCKTKRAQRRVGDSPNRLARPTLSIILTPKLTRSLVKFCEVSNHLVRR